MLEAYIRRAIYAQEKTNSLTEGVFAQNPQLKLTLNFPEVFFTRARQRAAELDTEFAATKKLKGPLHGVPVSSCFSKLREPNLILLISSDQHKGSTLLLVSLFSNHILSLYFL